MRIYGLMFRLVTWGTGAFVTKASALVCCSSPSLSPWRSPPSSSFPSAQGLCSAPSPPLQLLHPVPLLHLPHTGGRLSYSPATSFQWTRPTLSFLSLIFPRIVKPGLPSDICRSWKWSSARLAPSPTRKRIRLSYLELPVLWRRSLTACPSSVGSAGARGGGRAMLQTTFHYTDRFQRQGNLLH